MSAFLLLAALTMGAGPPAGLESSGDEGEYLAPYYPHGNMPVRFEEGPAPARSPLTARLGELRYSKEGMDADGQLPRLIRSPLLFDGLDEYTEAQRLSPGSQLRWGNGIHF